MLKELREALRRGEQFSGETVNYRKDGSEYYVEWDITPIRTSGGQISHFLSIQRNVTARKLAENQLQEIFRQVEKSRNDLGSILNELRIGTAMTDENAVLCFLMHGATTIRRRRQGTCLGMTGSVWIPKTRFNCRR
jgi:PAS domain-containing protein